MMNVCWLRADEWISVAFLQEDDNDYFEEVEVPKMSKNFAHYENIVNDPARITSWTNILGKEASVQKGEVCACNFGF